MNDKILRQAAETVAAIGIAGGVLYMCDNVYNLVRHIARDIDSCRSESARAKKTGDGHASGEKAFKTGFCG